MKGMTFSFLFCFRSTTSSEAKTGAKILLSGTDPVLRFFFAIMISAGLWGWGGKSRRGADSDEWPEEEGPCATDKSCWSLG